MKSNSIKPLAAAIGASFLAGALAPVATAGENPFALNELRSGYQLAQGDTTAPAEPKPAEPKPAEGKCGEGKCGAGDKGGEGKCASAKGAEGKCCHEGNCGGAAS